MRPCRVREGREWRVIGKLQMGKRLVGWELNRQELSHVVSLPRQGPVPLMPGQICCSKQANLNVKREEANIQGWLASTWMREDWRAAEHIAHRGLRLGETDKGVFGGRETRIAQ